MGALDEIRDATAEGALAVAKELGVTLKYAQGADAVWTDLYALLIEGSRNVGGRHGEATDEESLSFLIPRQTGFPPAVGSTTGAVIRYASNDYEVESVTPDQGDAALSGTFTVECGRFLEGTAEISEAPA